MNIERAVAVITDMVNLMTGEDPIQSNFLSFLQIMSKTTFRRTKVLYKTYEQAMKNILLGLYDPLIYKKLRFSVYSGGRQVLGINFGREKIRES